ncbi:ce813642-ac17-4fae-aaa5-8aa3e7084553 [Thermothielavioides terrestris]|uniref:Ce813642-ac17-4fae-aaa5-8aa3e7084553 n=1 Tax=Thermothielavioides terrestris TaxID=2587410 RepID=A0A446BVE9_9PEZI|nr:ce813642-ac17-4fae-aaa5-8aa3e7084553 [Thermothielavioides terrestris]
MQTARNAAAASLGSRLLGEIEETTLDEVLASLRTSFATSTKTDNNSANDGNAAFAPTAGPQLKTFPFGPLNDLVGRHFRATQSAPLAVTGRHRELLYVLVATLVAPPHEKAVSIVDFEGCFDPVRLLSTSPIEEPATTRTTPTATTALPPRRSLQRADLDHVHILRPARGSFAHVADCLASIEDYMLYGSHRSRGREWWGTVVIGGGLNPAGSASAAASASSQVAVTADWKGWLRIDRAEVPIFADMSAEEALANRDRRQAAVDDAGWVATSP